MEHTVVAWEVVAKYVIAVEWAKKHKDQSIDAQLQLLERSTSDELRAILSTFGSNRAAKRLTGPYQYVWTLREMNFGTLYFRPPQSEGKRPTVREFVDRRFRRMSEDERLVLGYEAGNVRQEVRRIVVHQEEMRGSWYIGDGYHRAVVICYEGANTVEAYAGELIPPAKP